MVAPEESVLYRPGPARWTREQLISELRSRLPSTVEQAFLFGSYARQEANADSDIDLILVVPTDATPIRRPFEFIDSIQGLGAVDLLVYTPVEWAEMRRTKHFFLDQLEGALVQVR